jgi:hypothetical protein
LAQWRAYRRSVLLCLPAASLAAGSGQPTERGKAILLEKCGRNLAAEAVGESPLKIAPPMRGIYPRFSPRALQQELLEGIGSRHKEMPQIQFSQEDVAAIMAYLYELALQR